LKQKESHIYLGAAAVTIAAFLISLYVGKYNLTLKEIFQICTGTVYEGMARNVFFTLRLPRTIMALLAGFGLSMAGAVYQNIFKNPLAAPDLIGVANGATAGAAFSIVCLHGGTILAAGSSFVGGITAVAAVVVLAGFVRQRTSATYVLAGIAVKAAAEAFVMAMKYFADPDKQLSAIDYWAMGSFANITMDKLRVIFPVFLAGFILGVGKTADMQLSLSTFLCTYPDGDPEYHCPRNGFGDIPGSKGLRAVVVTGNGYFGRECRDRDNFFKTGKRLAHIILESEVCGQALPAYGSITLLELLKDKEKRTDFLKRDSQKLYGRMQEPSVRKSAAEKQKEGRREVRKTNYCCAPMCVVGCLNRHMSNDGEAYISPDQSEVMAALKRGFNIDDMAFTKQVQKRAMDLGITGTEFVTAAKMYLSAEGKRQDRESILDLLEEIDQGTLTGRIVASRTEGILRLYPDREDLVPLLDRKAIDDEMRFDVRLEKIDERYQSVPDIEYLYDQIFVLENLGFCIFTSFALLNNREAMELMAELFTYRTGVKADFIQLMEYAKSCREKERKFEEDNSIRNMSANIPPFTKVLYRYFEK